VTDSTDDGVTTRYMVVRDGGVMHDTYEDEDAAMHEAAGHDPAWGVIPVYFPATRVDEPEDVPAKKRAPARKTPVKDEPKE
jgi:hypothetical protein